MELRGTAERDPHAFRRPVHGQLGERNPVHRQDSSWRPEQRSAMASGQPGQEPLLLSASSPWTHRSVLPVRQGPPRLLADIPALLYDRNRHRALSEPGSVPGAREGLCLRWLVLRLCHLDRILRRCLIFMDHFRVEGKAYCRCGGRGFRGLPFRAGAYGGGELGRPRQKQPLHRRRGRQELS